MRQWTVSENRIYCQRKGKSLEDSDIFFRVKTTRLGLTVRPSPRRGNWPKINKLLSNWIDFYRPATRYWASTQPLILVTAVVTVAGSIQNGSSAFTKHCFQANSFRAGFHVNNSYQRGCTIHDHLPIDLLGPNGKVWTHRELVIGSCGCKAYRVCD